MVGFLLGAEEMRGILSERCADARVVDSKLHYLKIVKNEHYVRQFFMA